MRKTTLKILSIIIVVMMLFATVPLAVSAEGTTVCGMSANVGDIVNVEFKLTTPNLVVNAQFSVTYDATKLELIRATDSETFPMLTSNCVANYTSGRIVASATNVSSNDSELYDFTGGANLCVLSFRVIAEGNTDVTLTPEVIGGKNPAGISQNEVDYVVNNTLTNGATLTRSVKPNAETIVYGDANGDGKVDSVDATLVLQHYASINQLTQDAQNAADVNKDSRIDSTDATLILQKYAEIIVEF